MTATSPVTAREPVGGERLHLPLRLERRKELDVDGAPDELVGRRAEQHLARLGCLLEPGGDVHGVARDELVGAAGHDLARVDADADVDLDRVAQLLGGAHGTKRVVLANRRARRTRP